MAFTPQFSPSVQPLLLVGRDRERDVLTNLFAATRRGQGRLALVSGEAGIGKTALAAALGDEASSRGALVLIGRCYDHTETPPYGLWVDLFARCRHREELSPPPAFAQHGAVGPVESQAALFNQVLDFLRAIAARSPLVLLLDDLHWSDSASLNLLRFLARSLTTLPILIVATYRTDEGTHDNPLDAIVPMLVREADARRLPLVHLAEDDVHAYVAGRYTLAQEDLTNLVRYLHMRSDGNPLFMRELLQMLADEDMLRQNDDGWMLGGLPGAQVPLLIRQVIETRLARLGAEARRLLAVAAVIGPEIALDLWHDVSGAAPETLLDLVERAVATRVLEETADGTAVLFVHAVIRDVLYEGMLVSRRRSVHQTVAEALAAAYHPDPDTVAHHFVQAGDPRAAEWLVRAGEIALRAYAWVTATARFNAALALLGEGDADVVTRGWVHYCLALTLRFVAPQDALAHLDEVIRVAEAVGDDSLHAGAVFQRGSYRFLLGDTERAIAEMIAGVALLDALPSTRRGRIDSYPIGNIADCHGTVIHYLAWIGRAAEAVRFGERFVAALADTAGGNETTAMGNGYMGLGFAYALLGRTEAADDAFARGGAAFQSARVASDVGFGFVCLFASIALILPYDTTNRARRAEVADAGEAAWRRDNGIGYNSFPRAVRLPLLVVEGHWSEARSLAEAVCTRPLTATRQLGRSILGPLAHAQGDVERAGAVVRETLPAGPTTTPGTLPLAYTLPILRLAAALALDASDLTTAHAWLEAHDRWLAWSGATLGQAESALLWSHYHRTGGDGERAEEQVRRALALATALRQPLVLIAVHRLLGELDTEHGRYAEANGHLDEALALADACGSPYERALTLLARAELRAATSENTTVLRLLEEAQAICTPLGAQPALLRAERLAARLTPHRAELAAPHPAGLTEREVAVLRLLATGGSNREIGITLGITTRTAERHISNIYTKIGAYGRAEAATYAIRQGLL